MVPFASSNAASVNGDRYSVPNAVGSQTNPASFATVDHKTRVAFAARLEIDRDDFNVSWNMPIETGGVLVGKHVQIELEVQAVAEGQ